MQNAKGVRTSAVLEADDEPSVPLAGTEWGSDTSVINNSSAKGGGQVFHVNQTIKIMNTKPL